MIDEAAQLLSGGADLTAQQMETVMEEIMTGIAATPRIVVFLRALSARGETVDEVTAAASVMRRHAVRLPAPRGTLLDTCGTGGDCRNTFNISTAAAFVAAGAGVAVAKHGNRCVSSASGSADVLEALGVNITLDARRAHDCLRRTGIVFLLAPHFHPAVKYAMPARREIGARTIFNILGPLSNPAGATHQMIGVFDARTARLMAHVLARLGTRHALLAHSRDGLDEFSTLGPTSVWEVRNGGVETFEFSPADFDIPPAAIADIAGGTARENARMMCDIFGGKKGALRDIVVLNAAAALYAADYVSAKDIQSGIGEGIRAAAGSIDSGAALKKLEILKDFSHRG